MLYFVKTTFLREKIMPDKYRVICSENQKLFPGQTFVDIYPAGSMRPENCLTHDGLLQMRRLINPDVQKLESGIILTDFGHGNILLQYEKMPNRRMQQYQDHLRQKLDPLILNTFRKMKNRNKDRTLEVSIANMAVMYDLHASPENEQHSAREDLLIRQNAYQKRLAEKRRELIERKAKEKYASAPQILLAWKQSQYRGD